jgi:hypothetical protein
MPNILRRRALLLLAGAPAPVNAAARKEVAHEARIPTDPEPMNAFAHEYNRYGATLKDGVIDVKQWARVARAWERLVH